MNKMWVEKLARNFIVSVGLRRAHRRIISEARVNESGITPTDTKREIIIFTIFS